MEKPSPIFEETYRDYLRQIGQLDLQALAEKTGLEIQKGSLILPFFGRPHKVSAKGIVDASGEEPSHSVKVVLCKYLLLYPSVEPQDQEWFSYKDFREGAPFFDGFQKNTERAIARNFAGKLEVLRKACLGLGGKDPGFDWNYQLKMSFEALPRIPLVLLFNDQDEEFPAQCLILFERRASQYLDMECLAIVAWILTDLLHLSTGVQRRTIM